MATTEEITITKNKSHPIFGGLFYIGCRDVDCINSDISFTLSSLGIADVKYRLHIGESTVYVLDGIGKFNIRANELYLRNGYIHTAILVITLLDAIQTTPNSDHNYSAPNTAFSKTEISIITPMIRDFKNEIQKKYNPTKE